MLHELDGRHRAEALATATRLLAQGGQIGILEWSLPEARRRAAARLWRATIRLIEPPVALEVLHGGLERALDTAGLRVVDDHPEAGGRARVVVAAPA